MQPELTILVVVGERRDRAVGALASVLAQDCIDRLEILLFNLAPGEPPPIRGSDFEMNEHRRYAGDVWD